MAKVGPFLNRVGQDWQSLAKSCPIWAHVVPKSKFACIWPDVGQIWHESGQFRRNLGMSTLLGMGPTVANAGHTSATVCEVRANFGRIRAGPVKAWTRRRARDAAGAPRHLDSLLEPHVEVHLRPRDVTPPSSRACRKRLRPTEPPAGACDAMMWGPAVQSRGHQRGIRSEADVSPSSDTTPLR